MVLKFSIGALILIAILSLVFSLSFWLGIVCLVIVGASVVSLFTA